MAKEPGEAFSFKLWRWWSLRQGRVLWSATAFMLVLGLARQGYEFWRLLLSASSTGATDLRNFHWLVQAWFAQIPVYAESSVAVYPPATYLILWPLLGWPSMHLARWLWAATTLAVMGWLAHRTVRETLLQTRVERLFSVLFLVSAYPTAVTVGNGQLTLHVVSALLTAVLLLTRAKVGWRRDVCAALLFTLALVKPSLSVPFIWICFCAARPMRPIVILCSSYLGLTLLAAAFQPDGLMALLHGWRMRGFELATAGGYGNIHMWLGMLGAEEVLFPSSLLLLLLLGAWVYHHRKADVWHLLGVSALVARFWTYHRLYDDLLILLPIIALVRTAKNPAVTCRLRAVAGALVTVSWLLMLAPGTLARVPYGWPFRLAQVCTWLLMLALLIYQEGHRQRVTEKHRPAGGNA